MTSFNKNQQKPIDEQRKMPIDAHAPRKRKRRLTLSVKIILILFGTIASVNGIVFLTLSILRLAIGTPPFADFAYTDQIVSLFSFAISVISFIAFAFILNWLIVSRVKRLNETTKEIASGNFDIKLNERGGDELAELATSFNRMSGELKANEYLGKEFVRNISHEYKTPLSVIKAYAEWIESEANEKKIDKETLKEYAAIIMKETDRLAGLSKSMLQLSLLDSTTIIKKEDEFSPSSQINDIIRSAQVRWADKKLDFDLHLDESVITSNEELIYQVWQNLVSNAIKFSKENGQIKIDLNIAENAGEKKLTLGISNFSEITLTDEDKEKIFNQFYMADKSRNTQGSGLGLSIVKKIIDKLGGEIKILNTFETATTFMVTLPL